MTKIYLWEEKYYFLFYFFLLIFFIYLLIYVFIYLFVYLFYFIIIIYLFIFIFSGGYIRFCRTLHTLSPEGDNMCSHHRTMLSSLRGPDVLCHTVTMLPQSLVHSQCITEIILYLD